MWYVPSILPEGPQRAPFHFLQTLRAGETAPADKMPADIFMIRSRPKVVKRPGKPDGPKGQQKTRLQSGFSDKRCDQVCKPSSVLDSHLSWPDVAIAARCHLLGTRRAGAWCPSAVLLRIGFAEPRGLPRAGGLLPRLSTLAANAAVFLCCTFPGVAPGGR